MNDDQLGVQATDELDVFRCALAGINQIEASAGTGKTWNICALYVRLLLEKEIGVEQILVVTFTKAATAELRERIRGRLMQLAYALENGDDSDPFVAQLCATTLAPARGLSRESAVQRVRRALHAFDQAAIHTIHAFCQRALQEAPFAAALPFAFETEVDDAALRLTLAADFWHTRVEAVAAAHPGFARWLVQQKASPITLDTQLQRRLRKPLARLCWDGITAAVCDEDEPLRACFDAAVGMWQAQHLEIATLLDAAQPYLNQRSHKPDAIAAALSAWAAYSAQTADAPLPEAVLKLTQPALAKATKKGGVTPVHPFFALTEALAEAGAAADQAQRARWLALLAVWLEEAPGALAERKRSRRVASFDDLLANLHRALEMHPWLAAVLRARYPAALIDEFQDTDPLQYAIFDTIFAPAGPLFLVGDPKQAIYSFRAADLHTYLAARARASARYTLAVNQRSVPALVSACNRLFSANPRAFVLPGLDYRPVRPGARSRLPLVDPTDPAPAAGACRIWMLPAGAGVRTKREAQRLAAQACAAEIARLLREATVTLGSAPLSPGAIAVLTQTHKQGSIVKRALAAWGIGSVELAQASVFATVEAQQLERVLAAIDAPGDARRLRAALTSDWFGLNAATLWQLEHDDASAGGAMHWAERFTRYRLLWRERGFAVMWRTLVREARIAERLIAAPDGERRVTDVNHLAELVQTRATARPGIAPTLRWFTAQRREGGGDAAQLRLESDRNLVQIVTVHKAKGLEYAVVFCPFLNDGGWRGRPGSALPDAVEYRDAAGGVVLHYGCDAATADQAAHGARREQAAERVRLVYVALTRAVYRCYLVAGVYQSAQRSTKEARGSVLNWLAAGAGRTFDDWLAAPPDEAELEACWQALADSTVTLAPLPAAPRPEPLTVLRSAAQWRPARRAARVLGDAWRMVSFSSLTTARAHAEAGVAPALDDALLAADDAQADAELPATGFAPVAGVAPQLDDILPANPVAFAVASPVTVFVPVADDILAFPRGAAAGECLHRLFELADFAAAQSWATAAARALRERPVNAAPELLAQLPAMMLRLLGDLTITELVPGLTLAALDPARRLIEMAFLLTAPTLDTDALRHLLAAHGYPDVALEPGLLTGFVKGFIDMIIEHEGRYWIIDWKSNHLGATPAAYSAPALDAAMAAHAYHLQALLYTVALQRYLRLRLPNYDYDVHIAGYLYLFVRGVRPAWRCGDGPAGVHARRPSRVLIDALDGLLGGA